MAIPPLDQWHCHRQLRVTRSRTRQNPPPYPLPNTNKKFRRYFSDHRLSFLVSKSPLSPLLSPPLLYLYLTPILLGFLIISFTISFILVEIVMSSLRGVGGDIESGFISATPVRRGLAWLTTSAVLLMFFVLYAYILLTELPRWLVIVLLFVAVYFGRYSNNEVANWLQNGGVRTSLQQLRLIGRAVLNRDIDNLDFTDAHPPALSEEDINSLPLLRYKVRQPNEPGEGSEGMELICCVCLEQVNAGDLIRTLPCRHQFHASCISPWLQRKGTCPFCKYRIIPGQVESGSGESSP